MTHLRIIQNNGVTEEVSSSVILKLYELATSGDLDNTSVLLGRINATTTYQEYVDYLNGIDPITNQKRFPELYVTATRAYLRFLDTEVERVLLSNNIGDGVGITSADAAARTGVLGNNMFDGNTVITNLNDLVYFTGISDVGESFAKNATNLVSVHIPGNVTQLSYTVNNETLKGAFKGCTSLTTVTLDEGILKILNSCFYGCTSLRSIHIPSTVTQIGTNGLGKYVFLNCTNLQTVTGCLGVTEIGRGAFSGCTSLTSIDTSNVVYIRNAGFLGCSSLRTLDLSNVETLGISSLRDSGLQGSINLPAFINFQTEQNTNLMSVFQNCTGITSITFGSNYTGLIRQMNETFSGCTNLTTISGLTTNSDNHTIAYSCFTGCTSLTSIGLPNLNHFTNFLENAFSNCSNLVTSLDLTNVTKILAKAFNNCSKILFTGDLNISLEGSAGQNFFNCDLSNLTSITVNQLLNSCFSGCTLIPTVTIGADVTIINNSSFKNTTGLTTILGATNVTSIAGLAFLGSSIQSFPSAVFELITTFSGTASFLDSQLSGNINLLSCTTISERCFNGSHIISINAPSLTTIPSSVFSDCLYLTSVTLGSSVTSIANAFASCPALTSFTITTTTPPTIGSNIFQNSPNVVIYVPSGSVVDYLRDWSMYSNLIQAIPTT